jgi:glycosyltransferase involved in cell wall biosynthesis
LLKAANPHALWRLRQVKREFRPDVVFVKMFLTQLSPIILPLLRDVPAVLSVINYNLVCPLNTKVLPDGQRCESPAGRACHTHGCLPWLGVARDRVQRGLTNLDVFQRVFANSRWVAERLRAQGVRIDEFIHNGIPVTPQRASLGQRPVIAYAGRVMPKKGVDILIEAFSRLSSRVPGVQLLIVGDGPERERLERQVRLGGLDESVEFLGHLAADAMRDALAEAWVQAVPSRWEEPFGLVAAEGMMRGTAVVVSDSGGLTEQVLDGHTGYHVASGDPQAWARTLERIVTDRSLAERLGQQARGHALAHFSFDRYADRVLNVFNEVCA